MKLKNIILTALFSAGCLMASAQEEVKTEYVFNPHWYIQGQVGFEHTLGEVSYGFSPNAQLGIGYQWNEVLGTRLVVDGWQSKGGSDINFKKPDGKTFSDEYKWKWNFIAPSIDLTVNMSNLIGGYNPERLCQFTIFAGPGVNFAFNNDEAKEAQTDINNKYDVANKDQTLRYLWEGNKVSFLGHMGGILDFRCNESLSISVEAACNVLSDKYNSKKANNADWYFTGLVGLKYSFGKTHSKKSVPVYGPCEPQIVEKIVEKIVEVPANDDSDAAYGNGLKKRETLRRDIFFLIRGSEVSSAEMTKLDEVAQYLNKYPEAKVSVTGYADKGTGNAKVNRGYAENRAKVVSDLLKNKYGISANRIIVDSKGDSEQPYEQNDLNRVTICIAE